MKLFKKKNKPSSKSNKLLKDPIFKGQKPVKKTPQFIQNKKPFPENNDPSVSKITLEKIWSLKNIQIALFIGFILLIVDLVSIFLLNAKPQTTTIIILISVIIYAIVLYFLLNPPTQKIIEKERIKQIETPTLKIIEKPVEKQVVRIVEKPIERVRFIEKPFIQRVSTPISIPVRSDPMKKYSFVASTKAKKIHSTKTTAGRMIKPENRDFANKIEHLKKKGYTEGQIKPRKSSK
jgi:hypothetical protein